MIILHILVFMFPRDCLLSCVACKVTCVFFRSIMNAQQILKSVGYIQFIYMPERSG